jgi:hypothetical protein
MHGIYCTHVLDQGARFVLRGKLILQGLAESGEEAIDQVIIKHLVTVEEFSEAIALVEQLGEILEEETFTESQELICVVHLRKESVVAIIYFTII